MAKNNLKCNPAKNGKKSTKQAKNSDNFEKRTNKPQGISKNGKQNV